MMNSKTCNLRRPILSLLYLVCFVCHFRPRPPFSSKDVLRRPPLYNIIFVSPICLSLLFVSYFYQTPFLINALSCRPKKTFVGKKGLTIDWSVKMPCYRLCIGTKLNAPSDRLLPCACDNLVKTPSARIAGLLFEKVNKLQIVKEDPA